MTATGELLPIFARAANEGYSISMTLLVNGMVVSGQPVSYKEYLEAVLDAISNHSTEALREAIRKEIRPLIDEVDQVDSEELSYIFLKDFQVDAITPMISPLLPDFPYLSVKLDDVSAWTLGKRQLQA